MSQTKFEARRNFVYFSMGYIAHGVNTHGITEPELIKRMVIYQMERLLKTLKMPMLADEEKKYFDEINRWVHGMKNNLIEDMMRD